MLRISQFAALLIPGEEYQNAVNNALEPRIINVNTPFYIGGLPNSVVAPHFVNRQVGYSGCLRKFEVSSAFSTFGLNFAAPDLGGSSTGTTPCYANVEPGAYFNGSSWIYYGKYRHLIAWSVNYWK